jgi:hypothetical protein
LLSPTEYLGARDIEQGYTVTVSEAGSAKYVSRKPTKPPDANGQHDDDYALDFTVSAATCDKKKRF